MNGGGSPHNKPGMLGFLRGFFGGDIRVPPVMVRARTTTQTPREVSIDAVWHPSGQKRAYRAKDAQGLCMLPWMKSAKRVSLHVRAGGAEANLDVDLEDARAGRTFDLALV
ncbi:hypothetical protein BH09MYX1_BH09MYX1_33610 [soil metagenome]